VLRGITLNRQETFDRSQAIDGSVLASGTICGAEHESSSSDASATSFVAIRLLAVFRTLFSPTWTTYPSPTLMIE
jgi:hypothetical protein